MKKRFYTLMGDPQNVHVIKDVGMFPYMMAKEGYYDSYLVSYGRSIEDYPNLKMTPCLNFTSRKRITGNSIIDGCLWLIFNSKKIDVLNLYHYRFSTFIWILFFKAFNPKGKIWVKLDISPSDGLKMSMSGIKRFLTKWILGYCTVVSSETTRFQEHANLKWPIKISYIPNGICHADIKMSATKDNIILTVGRLGTKQKATEVLINAFVKALPSISESWKLLLVGPIEPNYQAVVDKLFNDVPELKKRIEFIGPINDREVIEDFYKRARIFTMPSRWEGFCLVGLEAIAKADYLLTTDLISFEELTQHWNYGDSFEIDNIDKYAEKIIEICGKFDCNQISINKNELKEFLLQQYCYESICARLNELLIADTGCRK